MKRFGIHALYCKPNTSSRHLALNVYPYLLRNLPHTFQAEMSKGYYLHRDEAMRRVYVCRYGLSKPPSEEV